MLHLLDSLFGRLRTRKLRIPIEAVEAAAAPMARMLHCLNLMAELEDLERFPDSHYLSEKFFTFMEDALASYDDFISTLVEDAELPIQCHEGCVACCHDAPTGVSVPELLLIYKACARFSDAVELHNRACSQSDMLFVEVGRFTRKNSQVMTSSRPFKRGQLSYRKLRIPCIFLDESTKLCRIYRWRPISCRMHLSLTHPDWCWADDPRARKALSPNIAPLPIVRFQLDEIGEALELSELSPLLFRGLAELGGSVFRERPLRVANNGGRSRVARRRPSRRKK